MTKPRTLAEDKWDFKSRMIKLIYQAITGRKDNTMKTWYLADYKDENGNYHTALALCGSEEQAEEHFKKYDMSTVRIAAEDEIYCTRPINPRHTTKKKEVRNRPLRIVSSFFIRQDRIRGTE